MELVARQLFTHRLLISVLLIALSQPLMAQRTLDTINLQQADAQQIIPALRPHLSKGSSISQFQNTLVINATDREWQTIRHLLKQLDQQGKQLVISVRTTANQQQSNQAIDVEGNWGNDNVRVTTSAGGITKETRTRVTITDHSFDTFTDGNQQVRATEGYAAYISTGQSIPFKNRDYYRTTTKLVDASSGFYVTAFVNNNTVRLQLDQQNNQLKQGAINTQQLQSSITGQLGQWINVGSIGNNSQRDHKGLLRRGEKTSSNAGLIYLKVDLVD